MELHRESLVPLARQSLDVARQGFEAGRVTFAALVDAERQLLELELEYEAAVALLALVSFAAGALWRGGEKSAGRGHPVVVTEEKQATVWTCSMHPQIRLPEAGKCPICFMDLIPVEADHEEEAGPRELSVSRRAAALMELRTAPVERRYVHVEVPMVGKVVYDETRLSTISAWMPGRLERLFVDYTGVSVRRGDHLVEIYSPELLGAQEELLQAVEAAQRLASSTAPSTRRAATSTVAATREKLRLLGLTQAQVEAIEQRGKASDRVTIYAPEGGIVIHMHAREGMYVQTGDPIYTIADLARVWVELDAYESDLQWVRYGQEVEFTAEAHAGRSYRGRVSFVQPVLDEATRTVKVRVNVDNRSRELRPGMFVRARIQATVGAGGQVIGPSLAGKWIGPMHPEIVKDHPGTCDVCGMALVRAEELGYAPQEEVAPSLVIPHTAPLITGRSAAARSRRCSSDRPATGLLHRPDGTAALGHGPGPGVLPGQPAPGRAPGPGHRRGRPSGGALRLATGRRRALSRARGRHPRYR